MVEDAGTELFVLRVWAEEREVVGLRPVYRGRVEHVGHARVAYITGLEQLAPFISACLLDGTLPAGDFDDR